MIKTLTKLAIEGIYINIIKGIYDKHSKYNTNIILNGVNLNTFPLKSPDKDAHSHRFYTTYYGKSFLETTELMNSAESKLGTKAQ